MLVVGAVEALGRSWVDLRSGSSQTVDVASALGAGLALFGSVFVRWNRR